MALNTSGSSNTALGGGALYSNSDGSSNTAVGTGSLSVNQSGSFNTAVGVSALTFNYASENVAVGASALAQSQPRTFVAGIRSISTGLNDAVNVVVDSNGQLGTISSSRDFKDDIADMNDASAALIQLRPVVFRYKTDRHSGVPRLQYWLIAEEVAGVYPGLVAANKDGKPETVMFQFLAPMLLNEYQRQQRAIEKQAGEIAELKHAIEVLMARTSQESRVVPK